MALKKRHKTILMALEQLDGEATTRQIADKADLHTNGVSQSLGAMEDEHVQRLGGSRGNTVWKIIKAAS